MALQNLAMQGESTACCHDLLFLVDRAGVMYEGWHISTWLVFPPDNSKHSVHLLL